MTRVRGWITGILALGLAACASSPPPTLTAEEQYEPETINVPAPTPMIESPPIEPVEPPLPEPPPVATPPAVATTAPAVSAPTLAPPPIAPAAPPEPTEDQQMIALLADLQRYNSLPQDDVKKEIALATQALSRQRTDATASDSPCSTRCPKDRRRTISARSSCSTTSRRARPATGR